MKKVLELCSKEFEVSIEDALSKSRKTDFVYVRSAFIVIIKDKYDLCNEKIGYAINRTHSDVHYLFNNQPSNKYFNVILQRIRDKMNADFK